MSQYNIEMNLYDGSSYNQLYPQTLLNNVIDWGNNLYNKEEIDNQISEINNEFSSTVKKTIIYNKTVSLTNGNSVALDLKISDLTGYFIINVKIKPLLIYTGATITLSGPTYRDTNTYTRISLGSQFLMLIGEEQFNSLSLLNVSQQYSATWTSGITEESIIYITSSNLGSSNELCNISFIGYTM